MVQQLPIPLALSVYIPNKDPVFYALQISLLLFLTFKKRKQNQNVQETQEENAGGQPLAFYQLAASAF